MTGVLGIHLGTYRLTALVADAATGRVSGLARVPLGLHAGPGGVREQDPVWWWDAVAEAVRSFDGLLDVRAVAVTASQHGVVCVDAAGEPLGPASVWNDTSARDWAVALTAVLGGPEVVRQLIGMDLQPGFSAPLLARLRDLDRHRYDRTTTFCLAHDHLTSRLLGTPVTDLGDASGTGYFDVRQRRWSEEMLEAVEPGGRLIDRLPAIAPPGVALGTIRPEVARRLSLRPDVAVVNGTGEGMATAVAMGLFAPGRIGVSLDLQGAAFAYSPRPACDPLGEAAALCDATGGWLPSISTLNCAQVLSEMAAMFGTDAAALEQAALMVPPGAGGLALFPYVDGERTPNLPEGSGVLFGLGPSSLSAAHLARAAYDGVTLALAYGLEALHRTGVEAVSAVVAGAQQSPLWRQTLADVIGLPLRQVPHTDPAAWGAAALAAWAFTGEAVEVIVRRWWREAGVAAGDVTEPDAVAHEMYSAELARRAEIMGRLYPGIATAAAPGPPPSIPTPSGAAPVPPPGQPGGPPISDTGRPPPWPGSRPAAPGDPHAAFRP